jgi:hypothetical protein
VWPNPKSYLRHETPEFLHHVFNTNGQKHSPAMTRSTTSILWFLPTGIPRLPSLRFFLTSLRFFLN